MNLYCWEFTRAVDLIQSISFAQKQPPEVFHRERCSKKYYKIHRKTPVPESLFLIKLQATGLQLY